MKMKKIFKRKALITKEQEKEARKWFRLAQMFETYRPEDVDWEQAACQCRDHGAEALGFFDYDDFVDFKKLIFTLG